MNKKFVIEIDYFGTILYFKKYGLESFNVISKMKGCSKMDKVELDTRLTRNKKSTILLKNIKIF